MDKKKPSSVVAKNKRNSRLNLIIYLLLVVGIFFLLYRYPLRLDLTRTKAFTLSEASQELVENLNDPVRIRVFVSENLPPPLNEIEVNLRDILSEYNGLGGNNFTYTIYKIDERKENQSAEIKENLNLATEYGIAPQQIQTFEKDEVKLARVYFGLIIEYGDALERIPFLNNEGSLEYTITELISRLTRKNDKLIGLEENIKLTLYLNKEFVLAAQYFGIQGVAGLGESLTTSVNEVKKDNFNKVDFKIVNTISSDEEIFLTENKVRNLAWASFDVPNVGSFPSGIGYAALTIGLGDRLEVIELIEATTSLQLTSSGLQAVPTYQLIGLGEGLVENINGSIESLLDVNERIAYLEQNETVPIVSLNQFPGANVFGGGNQPAEGENFYRALSQTYQIEQVNLNELGNKYNSLVIAGAKESFNNYDLLLIDQFLMQGKSVIIFQDSFVVESPNPQIPPQARENNNNLNELLTHYGVDVGKSMVFDKISFVQRQQNQSGGVEEFKIYFAPLIQNINNSFPVLSNIKEIITVQNSPVNINEDNINKHNNVNSIRLFSSSPEAWAVTENISLIPQSIVPPINENDYKVFNLGYIVEGEFTSFFENQAIPLKPEEKENSADELGGHSHSPLDGGHSHGELDNKPVQAKEIVNNNAKADKVVSFNEEESGNIIKKGKAAKIMVIGSSQVIKNNIFGPNGQNINSVYILNLIDYMNNREAWGIMRGKGRYSNPLEPFDEEGSTLKKVITNRDVIKFFNMAGLPLVVIIFGFIAYGIRRQRAIKINQQFNKK